VRHYHAAVLKDEDSALPERQHRDNIEIPWAPMSYTISTMHCMTVLAGTGMGLGTIWEDSWRCRRISMLAFEVREIETDPFNDYYIALKMTLRTAKESSLRPVR
jgi:hypothetical protein